jgi:hypothetical protein
MADSDKSFGDKLLGFFIKEESGATQAGAAQASTPPGSARPGPASTGTSSVPVSEVANPQAGGSRPVAGSVDTKFVDHFAAVLSKANLQGPDYFEFREILRNLSNLGLSEDKQFQAAWASFKAMAGMGDPAVLANAANQYLTALNADREAFLKSVDAAIDERVGSLQKEQTKLQTDNEAVAKQIAELQQRVATNNDRLAKIGGEIIEQSAKINQNKANFEVTYSTFTDQIKADIGKIGTYLK